MPSFGDRVCAVAIRPQSHGIQFQPNREQTDKKHEDLNKHQWDNNDLKMTEIVIRSGVFSSAEVRSKITKEEGFRSDYCRPSFLRSRPLQDVSVQSLNLIQSVS